MQDVIATPVGSAVRDSRTLALVKAVRSVLPSLGDCGLAIFSAVLLIFSFPNFDVYPLAWIALIPLLVVAARRCPWPTFFAGWLFGAVFFYASCYWLTYSMINFGGFPTLLAYGALIPGALVIGLFPAFFALFLARVIRRWGPRAIFLAPVAWAAFEWTRLQCTGQLWNAIGYSQAFHPQLIGSARWGGVYAVGFLIVLINASVAFAILGRGRRRMLLPLAVLLLTCLIIFATSRRTQPAMPSNFETVIVAVQPNVPMNLVKSVAEMHKLTEDHFTISETALRNLAQDGKPRLVIWPESPMYFSYGSDQQLRERIASFAQQHRAFVLLNSQEVAPNDGLYNSAVLINEDGRLLSQYDKIRLLPFGEYVPLPRWLPGAGLITAIVGDFTPGNEYRQMQIGPVRTGVFICIESAYPDIARRFAQDGADVLINISNDGYLGPTAVMRQHLANAVFRAVENERPVLRVTNTGITAFITPRGEVLDATTAYRQDVRVWGIASAAVGRTSYTSFGDSFVGICAVVTLIALILSALKRRDMKAEGK